MAFSKWLLTASVAGLAAFAAAAQEAPPPADQPPEKQAPGLSDLNQTIDQLLREEGQPAGQAPPATEPPETTPAAEPAQPEAPPAEPEAQAPAPAPPARVQAASGEPPALTRAQLATLEQTVERGHVLITIARAGIVATQDMLTRISDPGGAGIAGWIAETAGNSTQVTFYSEGEGGAPKAIYRATVLGGRVTSREIFLGADRPALTPVQARMAAARNASSSDELRACTSQPFNVLVVPPASARAAVDVYRISAPAQSGRFPLGGHYKSTVAAGGAVETHAFADGCADAQAPPGPAPGSLPRPILAGRINDSMPTEVHMLLAQEIGRPLLVTTEEPHRTWLVTPDRIAELRRQESAGR